MTDTISEMTKKELRSEYKAMKQLIDDIGCYGTRDVRYFYELQQELDKRGMR